MKRLNKETIFYCLYGVACLLCLAFGELALLFKPLYKRVYYGQINEMFYLIISAVLTLLACSLLVFLSKKFLKFNPLRSPEEVRHEELPLKNVLFLTLITVACIVVFSALSGWQVKPLADMGERYTTVQIGISALRWAYDILKIFVVVMMLNFFQTGLEKSFNTKLIPWCGLLLLLTFGIYDLFIFKAQTFKLVYLFMNIVYGQIFLLTHKNVPKTFILSFVIYLL